MFDEHDSAVRALLRRVSVVDVDDTGSQQRLTLNGLAGEQFKNVVRSQHYGFSSVPPAGGEGVILAQGGRADRAHVLGLEHGDFRPVKRNPGESVLYDNQGQEIYVSKNGVVIKGGKNNLPLTITVGNTTMTIAKDQVTITSAKIILDGEVHLGGSDANTPVMLQGGGSATKAFAK